jgi:hypothetical protein
MRIINLPPFAGEQVRIANLGEADGNVAVR